MILYIVKEWHLYNNVQGGNYFIQTMFPVIDQLDKQGRILFRLFRDATRYEEGVHKKVSFKMKGRAEEIT